MLNTVSGWGQFPKFRVLTPGFPGIVLLGHTSNKDSAGGRQFRHLVFHTSTRTQSN